MKPVQNTHPTIRVGQRIKHKDWPKTGAASDYYEIGKVVMINGIPNVSLLHFDATYVLRDLDPWEIL